MKDSGNIASIFEAMHIPHATVVNNTCVPQDIETTAIPYLDNQPVDSQLWNGNFCLISLFGIDIYLVSELLKVDLIFIFPFHFYFIFSFIFDLFSIFRTRVRVRGTRSRCHTAGHIR